MGVNPQQKRREVKSAARGFHDLIKVCFTIKLIVK
jgi:hypothetical protein